MLMLPVACLLALPVQHPDQKALEDAWVDAKPSIPEPLALQFRHFLDLIEGKADACHERNSILPAHEIAAAIEECA